MAAGASVGMSDVAVHFEFGENSKPETERIFEKAKKAILEAMPHATITFVKNATMVRKTLAWNALQRSLFLVALTDSFKILVNGMPAFGKSDKSEDTSSIRAKKLSIKQVSHSS